MNKLYLLTVRTDKSSLGYSYKYYILAKDETSASKKIKSLYEKWDYIFGYVDSIKLVAEEGQYGNPEVFINASKEK